MIRKKENALRKGVKRVISSLDNSPLHVSWVESHDTAIGIPDLNYCCEGVEGWIELKCAPNIEIRAAQVIWFENRIRAGGHPLFLVEIEDMFLVVPGSRAASLRSDSSHENMKKAATVVWEKEIRPAEFLFVLQNPRRYYG